MSRRYTVDAVKDGESGWQLVTAYEYDLLLLDVTLPKLDGLRLCQRIRQYGYASPILMLTARDTSADRIMGLDAGADAYMVKPFNIDELLAQIRALLRRGQHTFAAVLTWGNLCLDPASYEVTYRKRPIRLTPKEFALLELLLRNGDRVLNRTTMIEKVWSWESFPGEDTIKAHIKSLRLKLKEAGAPKDLIETVYGMGYRLKSIE